MMRTTIAPKVTGLRNVVSSLDHSRLRAVVTFGSIIARMGVPGEAHYAVANEWMDGLVSDLAARAAHTRFLNVEWSVWAGAGMGERLLAVSALEAAGVAAIPVARGVEVLRELLGATPSPRSVVVAGRFGAPDTMELEAPALPLGRFLERPSVYYAGIELVADSELSADTDPYLRDHVLDGTTLLPAVMGMEAMAQAAMAVTGREVAPSFEDVELARPVTIPRDGSRTVRVAALVRRDGSVDVVLRSGETNFAVDHFRGRCRFGSSPDDVLPPVPSRHHTVALDPQPELYGSLLFQGPSFRRLLRYRALGARSCTAEVEVQSGREWFGRYLPPSLVLGDPGARDAFLHAVQACIPHERVVPVRVGRFVTATGAGADTERQADVVTVVATERSCTDDTYVYDITVLDQSGAVVERLESVTFRRLGSVPIDGLATALLGPYIERTLRDATGIDVRVALERFPRAPRTPRVRSDEVIRRALGDDVPVRRRGDGKPEVAGAEAVSVSHFGDLTLAVAGRGELGCDIEGVARPPASSWAHVLGTDALAVARAAQDATGEPFDTSATRVWTALESVKKAAGSARVPLVLDSTSCDGVVTMLAGDGRVATMTLETRDERGPVVVGIHVGRARA
jgi:enediyne polyketide synthase